MVNSDFVRNMYSIMLDSGSYKGEEFIEEESLWIEDSDVELLIDRCIDAFMKDFLKKTVNWMDYPDLINRYYDYMDEDQEFIYDDDSNSIKVKWNNKRLSE